MARVLRNSLTDSGSLRQAALAAGYSPDIADNPQRLTRTQWFQKMLNENLPADFLINWHRNAIEHSGDPQAVLKGVELGYRVHGFIDKAPQIQNINYLAPGAGRDAADPTAPIPDGYSQSAWETPSDSGASQIREDDAGTGEDSDIGQ